MKLQRTLAALGLSLALASAAHAQAVQGLDGDWQGTLETGGPSLRLVMHVVTKDGATTATLDSLDQNALGIPVGSVTREGQKVTFDVPVVSGGYTATLAQDGKSLTGVWSQGGNELPLAMTKK
jgi:hypothetical protein